MLLVVDTSYSIGKSDFDENVIPFLKNLVTSSLLNVGESGTHVGLILFSSKQRTKINLALGQIKDANELEQHIGKLSWTSVSGGHTRTDLALRLANEVRIKIVFLLCCFIIINSILVIVVAVFVASVRKLEIDCSHAMTYLFRQIFAKPNPQNFRPNIEDVVVLITDGEPRGKRNTPKETTKEANRLKNKEVRIITAGVGRQSENSKFIKILQELATSPEYFVKAQFDKMDEIMSTLIQKSCIQPGMCA